MWGKGLSLSGSRWKTRATINLGVRREGKNWSTAGKAAPWKNIHSVTIKLQVFSFNKTNMTECRNLNEHFSLSHYILSSNRATFVGAIIWTPLWGKTLKGSLWATLENSFPNVGLFIIRKSTLKGCHRKKWARCCCCQGAFLQTASKRSEQQLHHWRSVGPPSSHFQWEGIHLDRKVLLSTLKKSATLLYSHTCIW